MNTWPVAASLLERALKHQNTHTIEDVKAAIDEGKAQLWCGLKSALVTEIVVYPLGKTCRIWLAAGDMNELTRDMLPAVEGWAKHKGCNAVQIIGRHGWKRVLTDYHQPHTVLVREL